ncbi:hypothetical protein ACIRRA_12945 [Nocardia sp. NPDC101769]|uniref:hypothetical protein n=1 Tax=Nocardia sp. NPDC101769 TaxID=3364333 RepID=UPI00381C8E40
MACLESRAGTRDGSGDITLHWHEAATEVFLEMTAAGPRVEIAWTPTAESGVRVYLHLSEAEQLADALTAALMTHARVEAEVNGTESEPDWMPSPYPDGIPPYFGPNAWPLEEF